jgi:hypothetical protein
LLHCCSPASIIVPLIRLILTALWTSFVKACFGKHSLPSTGQRKTPVSVTLLQFGMRHVIFVPKFLMFVAVVVHVDAIVDALDLRDVVEWRAV